ncbi:5-aminoimidazole-4-carboxamide ribonucleotide transformylase [Actinopolymorpha pittospori]|uniref:Phosphoribosylaminoimidazolecarboxamide formyltransferase/IMP cyclohydrolase n=1 Tax=Actinopolymorpha pittospori TaxID=648752 RepID=A0A927MX22_9ACTN|nr:phosphoribosylaminoimidazolecarboxamide formyltransferase/IMP cyclohydrolase [Actinopolymorpha pittospori]
MKLRYGLNPHLRPASAEPVTPGRSPVGVVHGAPSYINLLDALAGWRLVREASGLFGLPAAASFKHVSPAGVALAGPVDEAMVATFRLDQAPLAPEDLSPVTRAYVRARDADPKSSFGDFVAVSETVDVSLARVLRRQVSDGIVAPGYTPEALDILTAKKSGAYLVPQADPTFEPPEQEVREVFGLRLVQPTDKTPLTRDLVHVDVAGRPVPDHAVEDLLLALVVLRHTMSNSVAYVRGGMTLGIGSGQQSRIDCTTLAGAKVDTWWDRRRPPSLDPDDHRAALAQVCVGSDGLVPFRDNIDEAARHGVEWFAEPGGSVRTGEVEDACREHGIGLVRTGIRLFQH